MASRSTPGVVWLLLVAVGGAALAFGPSGGVDGIAVTKYTVVVLAAILALGASLWVAVRNGAVSLPLSAPRVAVGLLAATLVARWVLASDPARAGLGAFGRWNGAVFYLACLVLFAVAARTGAEEPTLPGFLRGLTVVGGLVALAVVDEQWLGVGPDWSRRPAVAGTLGNANFLAAWAGVAAAAVAGVWLDRGHPRGWRVAAGMVTALLVVSVVLAQSAQGLYVLAVVGAVLVVVWASERLAAWPGRTLVAGVGVVAVGGLVATVLGLLQRGPLASIGAQTGIQLRGEYWRAAWGMFTDHPVAGVGPGTFSEHYRLYRTSEAADLVPLSSTTNAAHNVPLHFLAEWGVLVGLVYLAVLGLVLYTAVRELGERQGPERVRYAALVAAWLGYLVQSLVSVDDPALAVLGWVLAGLLVAPRVARFATVQLPWPPAGRWRRGAPVSAQAARTVTVLMVLAFAWVAVVPYRADLASASPRLAPTQIGDREVAVTGATELMSHETRYWLQSGQQALQLGELELGTSTLAHAHELDPDHFEVTVSLARALDAMGEPQRAEAVYREALLLEPHHPDLAVEVAEFARQRGDRTWARELVDRALAVDPDHDEARSVQEQLG